MTTTIEKSEESVNEFTFCKQTEITTDGVKTYYLTRKNGELVSNSLSSNMEKAKTVFKEIVNLGGELKKEEVLETVKISE